MTPLYGLSSFPHFPFVPLFIQFLLFLFKMRSPLMFFFSLSTRLCLFIFTSFFFAFSHYFPFPFSPPRCAGGAFQHPNLGSGFCPPPCFVFFHPRALFWLFCPLFVPLRFSFGLSVAMFPPPPVTSFDVFALFPGSIF